MSDQKSTTPRIITSIVRNDFCIGCGTCVPTCPSNALQMKWSPIGTYEPMVINECNNCGICLSVCPFSLNIDNSITQPEDDLKNALHIGYYRDLFCGYSTDFRLVGSSGGIATWTLTHILSSKLVDAVFCVSINNQDSDSYFSYSICTTTEQVENSAKTRYYPAKIDHVINHALNTDSKFAFIGLPCSIKALRLAQEKFPILKQRIILLIGIFCGGMKTKHYLDYLAAASGCDKSGIQQPDFRVKNLNSTADDYSFSCKDKTGTIHAIPMKSLGDMWGTGIFKPGACDFCDDISSEFSDISLGDAWIPPYRNIGAGTNIIITRSKLANSIIQSGFRQNKLALEEISAERINESQRGNINHRIYGLAYRLYISKILGKATPATRVTPKIPRNPLFILIQHLRIIVRKASHSAWLEQQSHPGTAIFDSLMKPKLRRLVFFTNLSHRLGFLVTKIMKHCSNRQ